jgi:hypothetical protein
MGAWTSDTPTLTASGGGFLLGSGSSGLRYQITGASVQFYLWFTFASDTAYGTGTWSVTALPFSLAGIALSVQPFYGQANSSAGRFSVVAQLSSATSLLIWGPASATNLALTQLQAATAVGGGTWGSGSFIRIGGTAQLA